MSDETAAPEVAAPAAPEAPQPSHVDEPVSDWVDPAKEVESPAENAPKEEADEESEAATDEGKHPEKEKKTGVQKRLDELTKKRREAEREAEYWRNKAQGDEKKTTDSETPPKGRPKEEDFDTYEQYEDALVDHRISQRETQSAKEKAKAASETATQTKQEALGAALDKGASLYDDFEAVVQSPDLIMTEAMVDAAMEGPDPQDVFYHLANNKEEAARIAELTPIAAAREIGKIELRLSEGKKAPKAPEPKRVTKAPEPIKPIGGKEYVEKHPKDMSMDEYAEWRLKGNG